MKNCSKKAILPNVKDVQTLVQRGLAKLNKLSENCADYAFRNRATMGRIKRNAHIILNIAMFAILFLIFSGGIYLRSARHAIQERIEEAHQINEDFMQEQAINVIFPPIGMMIHSPWQLLECESKDGKFLALLTVPISEFENLSRWINHFRIQFPQLLIEGIVIDEVGKNAIVEIKN